MQYPDYPAFGLLDRAARLLPTHTACRYYEQSWSYSALACHSRRAATLFRRAGVQPGDRVGILLPNVPEYILAVNAVWYCGGVVVAISPLMVESEVSHLLHATDCRFVIALDMLAHLLIGSQTERVLLVSLRSHLPGYQQIGYFLSRWKSTGHWLLPPTDRVGWFWKELESCEPAAIAPAIDPAHDPAYILPTGGTTGEPKSVTLSHRNLVANAWQQAHWAGATMGQEKMLAVLPFFHSYGLSATLLGGTALGAELILHHRFEAKRAIALIQKHRPTVFHAVPAMLSAMNRRLRGRETKLASLRWVLSGGAPLSAEVGHEFATHTGALVVEGYGLSEASPVTHSGPLDERAKFGTIGLPLPDTTCRIVDVETQTHPVLPGDTGELIVRGPQVMLGYWNDPVATAVALRGGWLHTGDLARQDADGFYQIVERIKDLIITSGFNVFPREVERVLCECPGVRDAAVIGVPDPQRGEVVKAVVVMKEGVRWDANQLNRYCHTHLSAHKRPRIFEQAVGDLPRNFLGKLVRRRLRDSPPVAALPVGQFIRDKSAGDSHLFVSEVRS